jgi:hypothetical protein
MDDETDGPFRRIGWRHQFPQCVEHLLELRMSIASQGVMLRGQRLRGLKQRGQIPFSSVVPSIKQRGQIPFP